MRHCLHLLCVSISLLVVLHAGSAGSTTSTTDGVIQFLEARLQHDPDDFLATRKLGDTYLQQARETGRIDCYPKAEQMFRRVLEWTPDSYATRAALASALMSQHEFREAAALAKKLIAEGPNEAAGYGLVGDASLEMGDVLNAEGAYRQLMTMSPGLSAYCRAAKIDWLRGNVAGAISNSTAALQFSNNAPESLAWARIQKGEIFFRTGRMAEAGAEYAAALKDFPDYYLAFDHVAELRAAQGKFEEAAKSFEQLAERTGRPEYWQAVGDVLTAARKPAEAKPFYDRALAGYLRATGTNNVHYFHHLAGFYADVLADGTEAEKWARRDLEVRQNIYAWDALAWALFWKKDYAGAAEVTKKALLLGTKDAQLLAHAAAILIRAGQINEGKELSRRATEMNPQLLEFHVHR